MSSCGVVTMRRTVGGGGHNAEHQAKGVDMTDIILVPGLWLDGSSWDAVLPAITKAGHAAHPVTLPGMESIDADRSKVTVHDLVDAVVERVDAADGPTAVVGHSAAAGLAMAAADARPDRVARTIYVGGFPSADGEPILGGFEVENGEIPLLAWEKFDDADLRDLDDAARARFRTRAIPSPGCIATEPLRLTDERRYDVPVTLVCPEFTSEQAREWMDGGHLPELAKIRDLDLVDVPTGHWPQFTRPDELGQAIVAAAERGAGASS